MSGGPGYNARYYDGYYPDDGSAEEPPAGRRGLPPARSLSPGAELTGGRS